ncbi:MAG: response regulator, partial [Oscillospiraceae bacterium]
EKINGASLLLLGLINDVLDMSAIEQGKLKLANTPFNLKELLTGLSSMYYAQCKSKGLQFDVVLSRITDETLLGDSLRLNQILLNLLSNAVKFTSEHGTVRLLVQETRREENRVFLSFTVEDNGEGMDEEMLSRLFRPFEQETATTAQKHGGSGLGLSIAKNLVEMMQGSIRVESQKGYGSQFSVTLPFQLAQSVPPVEENYFKKLRVLVVDDDKDTLDYTSAVLARIGVTHDSVASGEEAIARITRQHALGQGYDVCFVDLQMPRVNGIEVTRKIRELFDEDTVVIIISAYDLSEVETEARAAGANLFITKPLFQSTVFNALLALRRESYIQPSDRDEHFDFSGHRVLLAEDNALNREIAVELLTMTGMEVDCAENGQEAVDVWNASAPGYFDAILMDIQMPLLDGYEATRAIRAGSHPNAKKIAIYAMTANAFTDDVADALAAGMDGHIAKPIDTKLLYGALETAFRKKDNT